MKESQQAKIKKQNKRIAFLDARLQDAYGACDDMKNVAEKLRSEMHTILEGGIWSFLKWRRAYRKAKRG